MRKLPKVEFEKIKNGKWFWHLVSVNGQVICTPHQGFASRRNARKNFERVRSVLFGSIRIEGLES